MPSYNLALLYAEEVFCDLFWIAAFCRIISARFYLSTLPRFFGQRLLNYPKPTVVYPILLMQPGKWMSRFHMDLSLGYVTEDDRGNVP